MEGKVSIIVPIYNVEEYLRQCINSILSQTYKSIEVILVDDGSPDSCPQICDQYASMHMNVIVVHKQNGGLSSARNAGLEVATGDYVMFVDSDDFIEPDMVEALFELKAKSNADIVCCGIYRYTEKSSYIIKETVSKKEIEIFNREISLKKLTMTSVDCSSCNKLYSRDIIGKTRFKEGRNNEDQLFLFELYLKCDTIAYTNKAFYYYRVTPGSITRTVNKRSFDVLKNLDDIEKEIEKNALNLNQELLLRRTFINICLARKIQKSNNKDKFKKEYNSARQKVKGNIKLILFDKFFSIKVKLLALMIIFKLI